MKKRLPKFLSSYFWDVDFNSLTPSRNRKYIAERVLEYGDRKQVRWLFDNFSKKELVSFVSSTRNLSRKSLNFWVMYFGIPKNKVRCLKEPYLTMRATHWPY